jgi:hypothetical protein
MKEYKCFEISFEAEDTEQELNNYANEGWRLICSYAPNNRYLIMERDVKICPKCKK